MNIDRITTLLANGLKPSHVASIVGCAPGRISQLATQDDFQLLLKSKSIEIEKQNDEEVALSFKYNAAEHILIKQIMELAPMSDLRDVTGALRVVAERQEKVKARLNPVQAQTIINQVVSIQIPNHTLPEISLNKEGEVMSVNTLNLAPMTAEGVANLFKQMKGDCYDHERVSAKTERAITEAIQSSFEGLDEEATKELLEIS